MQWKSNLTEEEKPKIFFENLILKNIENSFYVCICNLHVYLKYLCIQFHFCNFICFTILFFWKNKMGNELDKSAFSTALVCIYYYYSMTSKNKLNGLISRKFPLLNNKMGVKTTKFTIIGKLFTLLEYSRDKKFLHNSIII